MTNISVLTPNQLSWYKLLDSGNGKKLEQIGQYKIVRPDSQALWQPTLAEQECQTADAIYTRDTGTYGNWKKTTDIPDSWIVEHNSLKFIIKLTPFGHIGVFPEQEVHWKFIDEHLSKSEKQLKVLNLFSYTGTSTMIASKQGAHVTHVDASKPALNWAVENQKASGLEKNPIRWIIDDALKFVKRERRRENSYDGILLDPPKFGRGPKGEVWQFEDNFVELLQSCIEILSSEPQFIIITAYAIPISSITLGTILEQSMQKFKGKTEYGELALPERASGKLLPTSLFARWSAK